MVWKVELESFFGFPFWVFGNISHFFFIISSASGENNPRQTDRQTVSKRRRDKRSSILPEIPSNMAPYLCDSLADDSENIRTNQKPRA
jgi:hypothetical protein